MVYRVYVEKKEEYDPVYGKPFESEFQEMVESITGGVINDELFVWR